MAAENAGAHNIAGVNRNLPVRRRQFVRVIEFSPSIALANRHGRLISSLKKHMGWEACADAGNVGEAINLRAPPPSAGALNVTLQGAGLP
jgi:hypothetical protein